MSHFLIQLFSSANRKQEAICLSPPLVLLLPLYLVHPNQILQSDRQILHTMVRYCLRLLDIASVNIKCDGQISQSDGYTLQSESQGKDTAKLDIAEQQLNISKRNLGITKLHRKLSGVSCQVQKVQDDSWISRILAVSCCFEMLITK